MIVDNHIHSVNCNLPMNHYLVTPIGTGDNIFALDRFFKEFYVDDILPSICEFTDYGMSCNDNGGLSEIYHRHT